MKRLAAALAAVAIVAAAVWVRSLIDANGDASADRGGTTVVCDPALEAVCRARFGDATITVEQPGKTFDRLVSAQASAPDAWLVIGPWPAMVDARRTAAGEPALFPGQRTVAATPAVLVGRTDRVAALRQSCPDRTTVGWKCLAAALGQQWSAIGGDARWGRVTLGQSDGDHSDGLGSLSASVSSYFGRLDVSSNDFSEDDGFNEWFARLQKGLTATTGDPLEDFLAKPGSLSLVATTEAHASLVAESRSSSQLQLLYWDPAVIEPVVLAQPAESSAKPDVAKLSSALSTAGFRTSAAPPATSPSGPSLASAASPKPDGSPTMLSAGVLTAIRQLASEVTR